MTKPQEFREQRVICCETHYEVADGFPKGPQSGTGILTTGRVVWLRNDRDASEPVTVAFAEGIGVVTVDPQSLFTTGR